MIQVVLVEGGVVGSEREPFSQVNRLSFLLDRRKDMRAF